MTARPPEAAIAEGIFPFVIVGFLVAVGYAGYRYGAYVQEQVDSHTGPGALVVAYADVLMGAVFVIGFGCWMVLELSKTLRGESR